MPRRRPSRSSSAAAGLVALAAACAAALLALWWAAVRTAEGRRLDDSATGRLTEGSRAYDETSDLLDTISVSSLALLGAAIMAVALLRGRPRLALGAGAAVLGANLTTQYLRPPSTAPGPTAPCRGASRAAT